MKTYKPRNYSLACKSFGLNNKTYLTITMMAFFDLTDPDTVCSEQELWSSLPDQLGKTVPDMGFPKPHGELLVTGSCFAPANTTVQATEVSVEIGDIKKKLQVFGDREWQRGGMPSTPIPFAEMALNWGNSFGGPEFKRNPLGKGLAPPKTKEEQPRQKLPNIENPKSFIGSPKDKPEPACFAPIDLEWPQRYSKCGTYDGAWLEERWPWFPDNFNTEFFNTAQEDQYTADFFQGKETIRIRNMHPDLQDINSSLPGLRPRCFVTRKKELTSEAEIEFIEVHNKIDTVWLFPSILRGLVLYRGTIEMLDDEFADIIRIYVASEKMDEEEKPIDHYWEEQKRFWDRAVDVDMAPFEQAQEKVSKMLINLKQMPKKIAMGQKKAMGKAPRMHSTPQEMADKAKQTLAGSYQVLDQQESMSQKLQKEFGHLAKIDLGMFDRMRNNLKQMGKKVDSILATVEKAEKKQAKLKVGMSDMLKKRVSAKDLEKAGIDPDNLLPAKKINPWHDHGFPMVIQWRKNIAVDNDILKQLADLGFNRDSIKHGWFGVNQQQIEEEMSLWGREPENFSLVSGLVMPRFNEATLISVRIRPDLIDYKQDILVPGSEAPPLFLPAMDDQAPVVIISDELEARLVEQEMGDFCSIVAMEDVSAAPDDDTLKALDDSPAILIVLPYTAQDDAQQLAPWQKLFPDCRPVYIPQDQTLFQLHKEIGIRPWLMPEIPATIASANNLDFQTPEKGKPAAMPSPFPLFDIAALVKQMTSEMKAFQKPKLDAMQSKKAEMEARAREAIIKVGKDPDELLKASPAKKSIAAKGDEMAAKILSERDSLKARGKLTPENDKKMTDAAGKVRQIAQDAHQRQEQAVVKLAAARKKIAKVKAGELPDSIKMKFAEKGVDPEALKLLSREEVIARHEAGLTFNGANMQGVDLSELDLSGIDLSNALCMGTIFKKTNLNKATFTATLAKGADFTEATLQNADFERSVMNKAIFTKADLSGCHMKQALLKGAKLDEAKLCNSTINMTVLQKAEITKADFSGAEISLSILSDADAVESLFTGAVFNKSFLKKLVLDKADFSGASFPATLFSGSSGKEVCFSNANLSNGRIGRESVFIDTDFTGITMKHGCFLDSDLSGSNFNGATIEASIIENCNLTASYMAGISAKQTRFKKSNLERAQMAGINLMQGSLKKTRLVETDLSKSNLFGVDFYKAVLGKTNLAQANLKRTFLHNRTKYLPE